MKFEFFYIVSDKTKIMSHSYTCFIYFFYNLKNVLINSGLSCNCKKNLVLITHRTPLVLIARTLKNVKEQTFFKTLSIIKDYIACICNPKRKVMLIFIKNIICLKNIKYYKI